MQVKQSKFSAFRLKSCSTKVFSGFGVTVYKNKTRKFFGQEYYIVSCWLGYLTVVTK